MRSCVCLCFVIALTFSKESPEPFLPFPPFSLAKVFSSTCRPLPTKIYVLPRVSILKHREIDTSCGPCRGSCSRATRCASLSIWRAEHIGNTSYCTASPTHHLSPITHLPFSRPPHGHSHHTSSALDSLRFPAFTPPGLCFSLSSTCTVVVGLGRSLLALLNPALRLCAFSQINHPACPPHYSDYTHKDLSRTPILGYGVYVII